MTYTRRLAAPVKGVLCLHVGIRIGMQYNGADVERLAVLTGVLRKRFAASITLGLEGLEPLGSKLLCRWLADGLIDQSIGSGHEDLIINDLIDAAIRSTAESSIFVDALDLIRSPARWLKFVVEQHGVLGGATLDVDGGFLRVGQQELLAMERQRLSGRWHESLQLLYTACRSAARVATGAAKSDIGRDLTPRHLFVTKAGVQRLGGAERFKALPIRVGGAAVGAFTRATVLVLSDFRTGSDSDASADRQEVVSMYPAAEEAQSVVFDIWPAPYGFTVRHPDSNPAWIDVPRQILVGRRCPVSHQIAAEVASSPHEAVFIMSNYNKAFYLHAALYGWAMQAHPTVRLEIVDDISTDESLEKIRAFQRLTGLNASSLDIGVNENKRGTYWIRNLVISRNLRDSVVFFVNDSDDVSSALRTTLQLSALLANESRQACLFNIVRVNKSYSPLPLNNEVERYGTASLCFKSSLIRKVGYFQNIKKNADTEFIRRVQRFLGKASLPWFKLPVMFQPFDGANLTADVYQINQTAKAITVNLDARKLHIEISDQHHARLKLEELPQVFNYPVSALPDEYRQLGPDFLLNI